MYESVCFKQKGMYTAFSTKRRNTKANIGWYCKCENLVTNSKDFLFKKKNVLTFDLQLCEVGTHSTLGPSQSPVITV